MSNLHNYEYVPYYMLHEKYISLFIVSILHDSKKEMKFRRMVKLRFYFAALDSVVKLNSNFYQSK